MTQKKTRTKKQSVSPSPAEALGALWPALQRGEEKAVHEVRKLTRRAAAQGRVAGASRKRARAWRDLRRAVAPLRDRDAAQAHLLGALAELGVPERDVQAFREAWAAQRQAQFAALRLPEPPRDFKRRGGMGARVRAALREQAQALLDAGPEVLASRSSDVWHAWRKDLKAYRYTLEMRGKAPAAVTSVLDDLGRLQDAEVVSELLLREGWLGAHQSALLDREKRAAQGARRAARRHWPALAAHLREQLGTDQAASSA